MNLNLQPNCQNHEDVFLQNYSRLHKWAMQICHQDQSLAEDLLHDAFIQFTLSQPNLSEINNLDGYLYTVIANLHISHLRKATRRQTYQFSIVEYESAELGLRNIDLRDLIQVQDELRKVCHFTCIRKETAKAASVMLLRFFLGYFPSEITQILKTTPQAVRARLKMARSETKAILDKPASLKFFGENPLPDFLPTRFARSEKDFLLELRETIFSLKKGECLSSETLKNIYQSEIQIDTKGLAHLVGCRTCLDTVNRILRLTSLSERHPADSSGNDSGGSGNASGGGKNISMFPNKNAQKFQSEFREVYEHYSQELLVAVNGYPCGSQRINAELNEQTFKLDLTEPLKFVEIFSEQQLRLAIMNVGKLPPEGDGQQSLEVRFSDDRTLSMELEYGLPWATLQVVYRDPGFNEVEELIRQGVENRDFFKEQNEAENKSENSFQIFGYEQKNTNYSVFSNLRDWFKRYLTPTGLTAVCTILLVITIIFTKVFVLVPTISASELLDNTIKNETIVASQKEFIRHRIIKIEVRNANSEIILEQKVEEWHSAERGLTVRRLFDNANRVTAGEWRRAEGISTYYSTSAQPSLQLSEQNKTLITAELNHIWRTDLSAKEFLALLSGVNQNQEVKVEETSQNYLLNYQNPNNRVDGIIKASLTVNRENPRAVAQIIQVQNKGEIREYSFNETEYDNVRTSAINPHIFEPDAVFKSELNVKKVEKTTDKTLTEEPPDLIEPNVNLSNSNVNSTTNVNTKATVSNATADFELEVLQLLNGVNAFSGDQISVNRTTDGKLEINGVVDSPMRKNEIVNALATVKNSPLLRIKVLTAEEAVKNQKPSRIDSLPSTMESVTVETDDSIAANSDLKDFFLRQGLTGEKLNNSIRRFSDNVLSKSREIRRHSLAIKQIAGQFTPEVLAKMDEPTRAKWRKIIAGHAQSATRQADALKGELKQIFPNISAGGTQDGANLSDAEIINAANKLFSAANGVDGAVRESFSLSNSKITSAAVKSSRFNGLLSEIFILAGKLK